MSWLSKILGGGSSRSNAAITNAGQQALKQAQQSAAAYTPYERLGSGATNTLQSMLQGNFNVAAIPGYSQMLQSGTDAITAAGSAAGNLGSGKLGAALTKYGSDLAAQQYNQQLQNLMGIAGMGQSAVGSQAGLLQQGTEANLNAQMQAAANRQQARQSSTGQLLGLAGTLGAAALMPTPVLVAGALPYSFK